MKDSSFIKEVVWKDDNLFVRLKSGKFYEYENVPEEVYLDFINADSLGKFFGENIKDQYEYTAFEEQKSVRGGTANLPKPWKFPKAKDFAMNTKPDCLYQPPHGSDVSDAWPFPTSKTDLSDSARWPFPTSKKP